MFICEKNIHRKSRSKCITEEIRRIKKIESSTEGNGTKYVEIVQEKEQITIKAQIAGLEAVEDVLSTSGSRISRNKRYSSNLKDWTNQYFQNAGIAGVKKRTINIMDTNSRLTKVTEGKEKYNRIRGWAGTGAYPKNE